MSDYEEAAAESDILPGLENFLYGILSNIVLKNSKAISDLYFGVDINTVTVEDLPIPLQAFFAEFSNSFLGTPLQSSLRGQSNVSAANVKETPLSLETFGWWWFSYANIVEVRYIKEYDNLFNPVWEPLTKSNFEATVGAGKRIVCKLFRYENLDLDIGHKNEFLELPILNEHFTIRPGQLLIPQSAPKKKKDSAAKKMMETMERTLGSNKNALLNLDSKVKQSKMAKDLNSADLEELVMATQMSKIKTKGSAEFEGATIQQKKGPAQTSTSQQPGTSSPKNQGMQGMQQASKKQSGPGYI